MLFDLNELLGDAVGQLIGHTSDVLGLGDETDAHSGGTLNVNGAWGTHVVLISTGTASGNANRPAGAPLTWNTAWWSYYVDDSNNSDLGVWFNTPASTAHDRDRLYTIP